MTSTIKMIEIWYECGKHKTNIQESFIILFCVVFMMNDGELLPETLLFNNWWWRRLTDLTEWTGNMSTRNVDYGVHNFAVMKEFFFCFRWRKESCLSIAWIQITLECVILFSNKNFFISFLFQRNICLLNCYELLTAR